MRRKALRFGKGFRVIPDDRRSQAAEMVIEPGGAEGDAQRGEKHEIRNTGRTLLKTVNVYAPPAYTRGGEPLPRGRR